VTFASVANAEEKPLRVSISVDVVLKNKVILIITDFHSAKKVASFEARLKDECLIVGSIGHVEWCGWQLGLLFHIVLAACSFQLVEVFALTIDVVVLDELLDVDKIGCDLAHWLCQVRIVYKHRSLPGQV